MIKHIYPEINNPDILHIEELNNLLTNIAREHNLAIFMLKDKTRKQEYVEARKDYAKRAYSITGDIGQIMKVINRTRTTYYNYLQ